MKRWLAAICAAVLFGMLWRVPAVCAAEEPEIPAAAYALMETETGTLCWNPTAATGWRAAQWQS